MSPKAHHSPPLLCLLGLAAAAAASAVGCPTLSLELLEASFADLEVDASAPKFSTLSNKWIMRESPNLLQVCVFHYCVFSWRDEPRRTIGFFSGVACCCCRQDD